MAAWISPSESTDLLAEQEPRLSVVPDASEAADRQIIAADLVEDKVLNIKGGQVFLGHYRSDRYDHPISVYRPDNFDASSGRPVVLKTTPLFTGARDRHNSQIAAEIMRCGLAVIEKGVPRYRHPTLKAIGLKADARQILSLAQAVRDTRLLGDFDNVLVYGESQAAMKGLFVTGLAKDYGFEVDDALIVAPCYLEALNWSNPGRAAKNLGAMAMGAGRYGIKHRNETMDLLKRAVNLKDLPHHIMVIPVLTSGETGDALPLINPDQNFGVELYAKDGDSNPQKTRATLLSLFPNARVNYYPEYGHADGIKCSETAAQRSLLIERAIQRTESRR